MRLLRIHPDRPEPALLSEAAAVLRRGGLVAFPTETVYGLGAHALDPIAVQRVFAAKGRPDFNPLIVHVGDVGGAERLVAAWPSTARQLAAAFWPGPLTLVLPKSAEVPDRVTAGLPTVAIRVPAHPVALGLLRAARLPVAAPSANRYTELSPTTAAHVARGLGGRIDLILDAGPTRVGIESAVLDLSGARPRLLRPGVISAERIAAVVGPIDTADAEAPSTQPDAPRPSPGMVRRHYAPRATLRLVPRGSFAHAADEARHAAAAGIRTGALGFDVDRVPEAVDVVVAMPRTAEEYAARLYAALHELDQSGCGVVFVEDVPRTPPWQGVRDRLRRAAEPPA